MINKLGLFFINVSPQHIYSSVEETLLAYIQIKAILSLILRLKKANFFLKYKIIPCTN